jgi:hypothetical protein
MDKVRVIAPMGATLHGPVTVQLSREQHGPRAHVLGPWSRKGIFNLDGDRALTFKAGEEIGVEMEIGRLNAALFELVVPPSPVDANAAAAGDGSITPQPGAGAA